MPPRYAFWTILIDGKATAFRAREREELLPTLNQLRRTNTDVALRYFSRGKLWDSPDQAQWAGRNARAGGEARGRDWRPGGSHKDPRARAEKTPKPARHRDGAGAGRAGGPNDRNGGRGFVPADGARRPFSNKDRRPAFPKGNRPAFPKGKGKPAFGHEAGARGERKRPWTPKPHAAAPGTRSDRPRQAWNSEERPRNDRQAREKRPWTPKPRAEQKGGGWGRQAPREKRPWTGKPPSRDERPRGPRDERAARSEQMREKRPPGKPPRDKDNRPWTKKPRHDHPRREARDPRGSAGHRRDSRPPLPSDDRPPRRDDWRTRPDRPDERREATPRPKPVERPDRPPDVEQVTVKPEPPERG
jgi:hypothetical protein